MSGIVIPQPTMAPFGTEITAAGVQDVWDTFVKPDQMLKRPQSVEMRILMGILRSVHHGLELREADQ